MSKNKTKFTFGDLFAGVGGFHYGLKRVGGECLYACEKDPHARKTYEANHGILPVEDVVEFKNTDVPYTDIITFGFPCQDLSSIGTRLGLSEGTRSSLVYDALDIVEKVNPKVFIAENVKGLLTHNSGETFRNLIQYMEQITGYKVYYKVLNSRDFGIPQNRERVYMVGIRKDIDDGNFQFPFPTGRVKNLKGFLEKKVASKYTLSDHLLKNYIYKIDDGRPFVIDENSEYSRTLNSAYHKIQRLTGTFVNIDGYRIRKLTPREIYNLQGFPQEHKQVVSDTQAYRQSGNAVTVNVVENIGKMLLPYLEKEISKKNFQQTKTKRSVETQPNT